LPNSKEVPPSRTSRAAAAAAALILCAPLPALPQTTVSTPTTPGLATDYLPWGISQYEIASSAAWLDAYGDLNGIASLTGTGTLTGTALTTSTTGAPTSNGQGLATILVYNSGNSATATTVNSLACWDSTGAAAIICPTSATKGVIGIVYSAPTSIGTNYYSQIVRMGTFACAFDTGGASLGHFVVASSLTAGDCADDGSTYPASSQPVGIVMSTVVSGIAYVFSMNDLPAPSSALAGLATGNTWTAGTQSFSSAAALIVPEPGSDPTASASIAYDSTNYRYMFGSDGITLVPTTSPLNSLGTITQPDKVCANISDLHCQIGSDATGSPYPFQGYLKVPTEFFSTAYRSIRVTYHLYVNSSSGTPPTLTFYLLWKSGSNSPVAIFEGAAASQPASMSGQQITITCTVSGTGAASTSANLYANCSATALGTTTVGLSPTYTISIPAIPANALAAASIPTVDTMSGTEQLELAVEYSASTAANAAVLLSSIPEFIQ
jgi:hypothetical protein